MERWGKLLFRMANGLGTCWAGDLRQVGRQDHVLRNVIRPILAGREWFFRRRDLPRDDAPEYNDGVFVFLKLTDDEHDAAQALAGLRQSLEGWGHTVLETTEWDGRSGFNDPYASDPEWDRDWREFCCKVAEAYLGRSGFEARQVAACWHIGSSPIGKRLVHWLCWITGDTNEQARLAEFGVSLGQHV